MDQLHHGQNMARMPGNEQAVLRSVQKPPSKPCHAGTSLGAPASTPPKVYRMEPREFRDPVQRLTGAPAAAPTRQQQRVGVVQPVPVRVGGEGAVVAGQMYASAPWCSFPLMALAPMHPGLDGHHLI